MAVFLGVAVVASAARVVWVLQDLCEGGRRHRRAAWLKRVRAGRQRARLQDREALWAVA